MKNYLNSSKSFQRFMNTFDRSGSLVGAAEAIRNLQSQRPGQPVLNKYVPDDMVRAAIVLCIAAMDTYFTDRFCEGLGPYLRDKKNKPTKELFKLIEEAGFDIGEAISVMNSMKRPMRRVTNLLKEHLAGYTTTNTKKIDDLFECFGIKKFSQNACGKVGNPKILNYVQKAVKRRHEIAHGGDLNDHGKLRAVDVEVCGKMLVKVQNFISGAEGILAEALPVPKHASKGTPPVP